MSQIHEMFESIGEEKNKVLNWVEVAKWVASIWNSSPCPDAFLSFPAPPELICTTSVHQVKFCVSHKAQLPHVSPMSFWAEDKERSRDGGEVDLLQRDNTFPFPDLNTWAHCCSPSSRSQKAEMLWLKWQDSPDWGSPASFSWVCCLLYWPLGHLLGWGSQGVMTSQGNLSLEREWKAGRESRMEITASTADSKGTASLRLPV